MSRRHYPTADVYDDRAQDFYRRGPRSTAGYEELDIDITRARTADPYARRQPDFLRDDYGRTSAGPLVVRDDPPPGPRRAREVEREEFRIQERSAPPRERVREEETDIIFKREERSSSRPARSARAPSPPPAPPAPRSSRGEIERDEFTIRRSETVPMPERPRRREYERDDIDFRRGSGDRPAPRRPPPREIEREEIIFRHEERQSPPRERSLPPPRERSLPPPRGGELVAREREELIVRRRRPSPSPSPSPPPPPRARSRERVTEEIVIRRTERSPTPPPREPTPPPPPPEPKPEPPVLQPITRPPIYQEIHQEIITHHRHIDHGVIRARSPTPPPPPREPTPPPPPPPRVKEEELEIEIRRRTGRGGFESEDIIIEREFREPAGKAAPLPPPPPPPAPEVEETQIAIRHRSVSPPARSRSIAYRDDDDFEAEADYYNRKALERGYYGEAHNRATKDWGLVDIPPGTQRVRMDGAGGGAQEITWQGYNGSRRSKFISGDRERSTDFGAPARRQSLPPPESKKRDMWTEVTKDLVIRDAVESMGYQYEETEEFFYVMEYLRYEDVLQLVEISEDIRRERQKRIREIEWEREKIEREEIMIRREREREREPPKPKYDERLYEREVIYDSRRGRH